MVKRDDVYRGDQRCEIPRVAKGIQWKDRGDRQQAQWKAGGEQAAAVSAHAAVGVL